MSETTRPHAARRLDIQGLRAVAVVLVVVFHSGYGLSGGFVGVDVFFVISGFVISRMLWTELQSTGSINLRAFYTRRVKRLLPALAVVLAFVAIGSLIVQSPLGLQQKAAVTGVAASMFTANLALFVQTRAGGYFATPSSLLPLLHTWTLAVEEQFYLFFPLFLLFAWRRASRRGEVRTAAMVRWVVALTVLSFLAGVALCVPPGVSVSRLAIPRLFAFYASPIRAWEFGLGTLLAFAEGGIGRVDRRVATMGGVVGLAMIGFASLRFDSGTPFPGVAALVPDLGVALLIAGGTATSAGLPWVLSRRPLTWLGDVSYGWYLWHWPMIVFTRIAWPTASNFELLLVAIAALLPTWLSYRFIENPIRFDAARTGRRVTRLALTCVSVPVVLFGLLLVVTVYPGTSVARIRAEVVGHVDSTRGCQGDLPETQRTWSSCTWSVPRAVGHVFVIGDSNAGQFAEVVAKAANRRNFDATIASFGGCPYTDLISRNGFTDSASCRRFVTTWTAEFVKTSPSLVIIANESVGYVRPGSPRDFQDPSSPVGDLSAGGRQTTWRLGLTRTMRTLTTAGVPVVLVHTVPQFDLLGLYTCPNYRLYLNPSACGRSLTRSVAEAQERPALIAEQAALAAVPEATGVSFFDQLCTATRCSMNRGSLWLYRDGNHLSVPGALTLLPQFEALIAAHAHREPT